MATLAIIESTFTWNPILLGENERLPPNGNKNSKTFCNFKKQNIQISWSIEICHCYC